MVVDVMVDSKVVPSIADRVCQIVLLNPRDDDRRHSRRGGWVDHRFEQRSGRGGRTVHSCRWLATAAFELLEVNMPNPRLTGLFVLLAMSAHAQWVALPDAWNAADTRWQPEPGRQGAAGAESLS